MKIIRHTDQDYSKQLEKLLASSSLFDPEIERRTQHILDSVRERGDEALLELTEKFDKARLTAAQLAVSTAESFAASIAANESLREAVNLAGENIQHFARRSLRKNWSTRNRQGALVGEKFDPIQRVGIYIPGGTAPLVSTALMTIVLAKVAGCPEIVVCTPPGETGAINPDLLVAMKAAGATEIYRLGGAQAIAVMAFGSQTIARVQKIFGPGNAYVVAAKRLLCGHVGIDLLPGPSEVLVLADESGNPQFIAADLLAQAEHGSGHERVWLITPSGRLVRAVEKAMKEQLPKLGRQKYVRTALANNGWLIQVKTMADGIKLTNALAPEHCEVLTRNAAQLSTQITTAGAIFLGPYSPTVLGDYVAGPSHVLPTGGAGASFAGLTVDQFQRRTSVVSYSRAALVQCQAAVQTFAEVEGLDAHGRSAAIRLERPPKRVTQPSGKKRTAPAT